VNSIDRAYLLLPPRLRTPHILAGSPRRPEDCPAPTFLSALFWRPPKLFFFLPVLVSNRAWFGLLPYWMSDLPFFSSPPTYPSCAMHDAIRVALTRLVPFLLDFLTLPFPRFSFHLLIEARDPMQPPLGRISFSGVEHSTQARDLSNSPSDSPSSSLKVLIRPTAS